MSLMYILLLYVVNVHPVKSIEVCVCVCVCLSCNITVLHYRLQFI